MDTSIRELKSHLSDYLQRVEAGETIVVTNRRRVVARIIPYHATPLVERLQQLNGISWAGGKPAGMDKPKAIGGSQTIADRVVEDRR